jgi:hypothetical protein
MANIQPNQLVVGSRYIVSVPSTGATYDLILKSISPDNTVYTFKTVEPGGGLWVYRNQIVNGFYKIRDAPVPAGAGAVMMNVDEEDEFANLGGGKRRRKSTKRRHRRRHVKKRKATKHRR